MAKARFKTRTNEIIKAKYVEKKTFKQLVAVLACISMLFFGATYRLYLLGDFKSSFIQITTYYTLIGNFIKGLF